MDSILILGDFYGNNPGDVVIEEVSRKWLSKYGQLYYDYDAYMTYMLKGDRVPNLPSNLKAIAVCGGNLVVGQHLPGYFEIALSNPNVKKIMFGTGVMPIEHLVRKAGSKYFSLFDFISVRDQRSANVIKELCPDVKVHVGCDVALDLNTRPGKRPFREKYITVSILKQKWGPLGEQFYDEFIRVLKKVEKEMDLKVKILPYNHTWKYSDGRFGRHEDGKYAHERYSDFEIVNTEDFTFEQLHNYIAHAEFHIGNRFHSCVSASIAGTPFIGIVSWGVNKIQGICEHLEMRCEFPGDEFTPNLEKNIMENLWNRNDVKKRLKKNFKIYKSHLNFMKRNIDFVLR